MYENSTNTFSYWNYIVLSVVHWDALLKEELQTLKLPVIIISLVQMFILDYKISYEVGLEI